MTPTKAHVWHLGCIKQNSSCTILKRGPDPDGADVELFPSFLNIILRASCSTSFGKLLPCVSCWVLAVIFSQCVKALQGRGIFFVLVSVRCTICMLFRTHRWSRGLPPVSQRSLLKFGSVGVWSRVSVAIYQVVQTDLNTMSRVGLRGGKNELPGESRFAAELNLFCITKM